MLLLKLVLMYTLVTIFYCLDKECSKHLGKNDDDD